MLSERLFFKVRNRDVVARRLDIDDLKTLNILKMKLGRQIPGKSEMVIEKPLVKIF